MEGQEPTTPSAQDADPNGAATPATSPQAGAHGNDAEKSQRELSEARSEAARYRKTLRDTEARLKDLETAQMSEADKAKKELEDLRGYKSSTSEAVKALNLQMSVERAARKLGIVDEEAAFALMDKSKVSYGDDGRPDADTVQAALDALLTAKPWLKPAPAAPAAPQAPSLKTANPGKTPIAGALTQEDLRRMTQEEINARWDEVQATLKAGR